MKYITLITMIGIMLIISGCDDVKTIEQVVQTESNIVDGEVVEGLIDYHNPEPVTQDTIIRPVDYEQHTVINLDGITLNDKEKTYTVAVQRMIKLCRAGNDNMCNYLKEKSYI